MVFFFLLFVCVFLFVCVVLIVLFVMLLGFHLTKKSGLFLICLGRVYLKDQNTKKKHRKCPLSYTNKNNV